MTVSGLAFKTLMAVVLGAGSLYLTSCTYFDLHRRSEQSKEPSFTLGLMKTLEMVLAVTAMLSFLRVVLQPCPKQSIADAEKLKVQHLFVSGDKIVNHIKFEEIFYGKERTETVPVPGFSNRELEQATDLTRLSMLELICFVLSIHLAGYSFGGMLSAKDLMMTYSGNLRGLWSLWKSLVKVTDANRKLDAACIAAIIRDCIFHGVHVPVDVGDLLVLLENFSEDLVEAVLQHPSLKTEVDALAQFGKLYQEFDQVRKTDNALYTTVIGKLPFCEPDLDHWKFLAKKNPYVNGVLLFKPKKGPKLQDSDIIQVSRALAADPGLKALMSTDFYLTVKLMLHVIPPAVTVAPAFPDSSSDKAVFIRVVLNEVTSYPNHGGGFMRHVRNDCQHLVEGHSVKPGPAAQPGANILFRYYQVAHMLNCTFPLVFCEFFRAMFDAGLVEKCAERTLLHFLLAKK